MFIQVACFCVIVGVLNAQTPKINKKVLVPDILADAVGWLVANRNINLQTPSMTMQVAIGTHLMIGYDPQTSISVELKADAAGFPVIDRVDLGIFKSFDQAANHLLGRECNESSQDLGYAFIHDGLVKLKEDFVTERTRKIRSFDSCPAKLWQSAELLVVTVKSGRGALEQSLPVLAFV